MLSLVGAVAATSFVGCVDVDDVDDEATIESQVLGPPANVTVTGTKPDRILVTWDPVPGAVKYYVDIGSSTSGPFTFQGTARAPDTFLRVAHLTPNTNYCFQVRTEDGTGPGDASSPVCSQTPSLPPPPGNIVASPSADGTYAEISWNPVAGATKYYVYQSGSANGTFTGIATVFAPATSVNARNLTPGSPYCFRVAVQTSVGTSGQSPSSCLGTLPPPTNVTATRTSSTRIRVDWTPIASGASKYYIYESKDGGARVLRGSVLATSAPTWPAVNLTTGSQYCYQLRSVGTPQTNISGYSTPPACATP